MLGWRDERPTSASPSARAAAAAAGSEQRAGRGGGLGGGGLPGSAHGGGGGGDGDDGRDSGKGGGCDGRSRNRSSRTRDCQHSLPSSTYETEEYLHVPSHAKQAAQSRRTALMARHEIAPLGVPTAKVRS